MPAEPVADIAPAFLCSVIAFAGLIERFPADPIQAEFGPSTATSAIRIGCRDKAAPAAADFSIDWPPQVRIASRQISFAVSITQVVGGVGPQHLVFRRIAACFRYRLEPQRLDALQFHPHLGNRDLLCRIHPPLHRRRARYFAAQILHW